MKKLIAASAVLAAMSSAAMATDQNINLSATVAGFCSIDGTASGTTPAATAVAVPVTAGVVSTAALPAGPYAVVCNKAADVKLTSTNGAMTSGLTAVSGFENIINYTATTSGFAAATVNTATAAAATGPEIGATVSTGGAATGNISVSITPANAGILLAGSYADTLVLSITPQ